MLQFVAITAFLGQHFLWVSESVRVLVRPRI